MGGRERPLGPTEDPAIDPATGMLYPTGPACDQVPSVLKPGERVELNDGARVSPRDLSRWEGSYRCALSRQYVDGVLEMNAPGPTLRIDVRRIGRDGLACQGPDGGAVMTAATVSMQLEESDGTTLHDGPCPGLASIAVWPAHTNLQLECAGLLLDVRADWVRIDRTDTAAPETRIYYGVQCRNAHGD